MNWDEKVTKNIHSNKNDPIVFIRGEEKGDKT
jgi:hypothetical protein